MAMPIAMLFVKSFSMQLTRKIDMIVGPEARGFIVGCPVAFELGVGFAPVRKPGKLPREVILLTMKKSTVLIP